MNQVFSTIIIGSGPCGLAVLSRKIFLAKDSELIFSHQDCGKVPKTVTVD